MSRNYLIPVMLCIIMILSRQADAIATADMSTAQDPPSDEGYSFDWSYVYKFKNSSSVAVDHYWILTAAHVADDTASGNLLINGEIYTPQETNYHSSADLALVRFDKSFPGYYLLHDGEIYHTDGQGKNRTTVYDELLMVGYGRTGAVTQTTFQNGPLGNGIKRWGSNTGSGTEQTIDANVGGEAGVVSSFCFHMDFNTNGTPYEAGAAQYDSGGPTMINSGGSWKVAGINAYLSGSDPNYDGNFSIKIADYRSWIVSQIPDYDTDQDGLPDWWELQYGGDETSMERDAHSDSDGFTNYEEWIADTDPTNTLSYFEILEWQAPSNVTFSTSSDRKYQIDYRLDLADTNVVWATEVPWFDGLNGQTAKSVSGSTSNRFYRVRAKLR